jgi:hypothetical protein
MRHWHGDTWVGCKYNSTSSASNTGTWLGGLTTPCLWVWQFHHGVWVMQPWTHRSDSALLGILYPRDTVRTWCSVQFVYWFSSYALSDLMICMNYEIHAPVHMRGLNCKIPGIYFNPSYMWTGGCCCSMEEIWQSLATSATFFVSTPEIDLAAIFRSLLASLWSSLQHFFGDCVKTWQGTLVHILIDMNLKQQLHGNLNSQL